jgi:hypothetical protein
MLPFGSHQATRCTGSHQNRLKGILNRAFELSQVGSRSHTHTHTGTASQHRAHSGIKRLAHQQWQNLRGEEARRRLTSSRVPHAHIPEVHDLRRRLRECRMALRRAGAAPCHRRQAATGECQHREPGPIPGDGATRRACAALCGSHRAMVSEGIAKRERPPPVLNLCPAPGSCRFSRIAPRVRGGLGRRPAKWGMPDSSSSSWLQQGAGSSRRMTLTVCRAQREAGAQPPTSPFRTSWRSGKQRPGATSRGLPRRSRQDGHGTDGRAATRKAGQYLQGWHPSTWTGVTLWFFSEERPALDAQ